MSFPRILMKTSYPHTWHLRSWTCYSVGPHPVNELRIDFISAVASAFLPTPSLGFVNFLLKIVDDLLISLNRGVAPRRTKLFVKTGYAVDATYTTSCAPPPMMEDLGLGSVAIARPASL